MKSRLQEGVKINNLTLLSKFLNDELPLQHYERIIWFCRCDCGKIHEIPAKRLHNVRPPSCKECKGVQRTISMYQSEYNSFKAMNERCYDPMHKDYPRYKELGITVAKIWRRKSLGGDFDFWHFLDHVGLKTAERNTLDRINNLDIYKPGNVRWASRQEQANNRRISC